MCDHFSEGDSGIFTSSYHSEQDSDPTFRLSVSQSFGKSFPDISEDGEDVTDGRELPGDQEEGASDLMRLTSSYTGPSTDHSLVSPVAPAKPRRTMVTSYSSVHLPATPEQEPRQVSASVRSRVRMFESMSSDGKSARTVKEARDGSVEPGLTSHKVEAATPTPAPVMSISSSSSAASCGYKDFLIDDDYIDQQQLIISSNREVNQNNGSSLENTLKEKVNKFLAKDKENDDNFEKSEDDDSSVRELFASKEAPGSSVDTLSEQESLSSEGGDLERADTRDTGESEDCGVFEIRDLDHQNDILQDVMDVNTLLLKLQSILVEVGYFDNYIIKMSSLINTFSLM